MILMVDNLQLLIEINLISHHHKTSPQSNRENQKLRNTHIFFHRYFKINTISTLKTALTQLNSLQ